MLDDSAKEMGGGVCRLSKPHIPRVCTRSKSELLGRLLHTVSSTFVIFLLNSTPRFFVTNIQQLDWGMPPMGGGAAFWSFVRQQDNVGGRVERERDNKMKKTSGNGRKRQEEERLGIAA